jgi:hypothetical protein
MRPLVHRCFPTSHPLIMHTAENKLASTEAPTEAIHRSRGSTASERLLADLGEQAFLDLWSYPNLFYEKKQGGVGDGKELCDMLVVCGDDVIILSDKHIKYQEDKDVQNRMAKVLPQSNRRSGQTDQRC